MARYTWCLPSERCTGWIPPDSGPGLGRPCGGQRDCSGATVRPEASGRGAGAGWIGPGSASGRVIVTVVPAPGGLLQAQAATERLHAVDQADQPRAGADAGAAGPSSWISTRRRFSSAVRVRSTTEAPACFAVFVSTSATA